LSNWIKKETLKSLNDPTVKLKKFIDTDFFIKQLEHKVIRSDRGKEMVRKNAGAVLPKKAISKVAKYFDKPVKEVTRKDVLSLKNAALVKITGVEPDQIRDLKLKALGVKMNPKERDGSAEGSAKGKSGNHSTK